MVTMNKYFYMPQRFSQSGPCAWVATWFDENGEAYPHFDTLDKAIDFIIKNNIFGQVQRFAKYDAPDPGQKPDLSVNPGHWMLWNTQSYYAGIGYGFYSAGVVWTAETKESLTNMTIASSIAQPYRGGTLWVTDQAVRDEIFGQENKEKHL